MDPSPALVNQMMELGLSEDSARRALKVSPHPSPFSLPVDKLTSRSGMETTLNVRRRMVSLFPLLVDRRRNVCRHLKREVFWNQGVMEG
jgi:hypothetical protein